MNPVSRYVESVLLQSQGVDNFGELLSPLNVRYVILVHEADFQSYGFLREQKDLGIALERPGVTLFRNTYPHGRAYAVDEVKTLGSLEKLVELSRTEDILSSVYALGAQSNPEGPVLSTGNSPEFPVVQRNHSARFTIGETKLPYTVLVTKYGPTSRHWRLGDEAPELMNLGMMPVYSGDGSAATATFSRWAWIVALDGLALFVALVSVGYLLWPRVKLLIEIKKP